MKSTLTKSDDGTIPAKYRLKFLPQALAEWQELDGSIKERLRKQAYRLSYPIEEEMLVQLVRAIARLEDSLIHQLAALRLGPA